MHRVLKRPAILLAVVILAAEMFVLGSEWYLLANEQSPRPKVG